MIALLALLKLLVNENEYGSVISNVTSYVLVADCVAEAPTLCYIKRLSI